MVFTDSPFDVHLTFIIDELYSNTYCAYVLIIQQKGRQIVVPYFPFMRTLRFFRVPLAVAFSALVLVLIFLGVHAFLMAVLLTVLEVTLSFDNAVVNARVLERMNTIWRRRFLTWGILIAVIGTRFVLPIVIVSAVAAIVPWEILRMAITDVAAYGELLAHSDTAIKAFGGIFLAMVALKYFIDDGKTIHWVHVIERKLARLGSIEYFEVLLCLVTLVGISYLVSPEEQATILVAGLVGLILFLAMEGVTGMLSLIETGAAASGVALFLYLNVLDSAFSLDGVVGAFALTNDLIIIAVGLGIGAYLVRSMTVYLVDHGTLKDIRYLEHGAHWAILGLAASMLVGLTVHVPEVVTGLVGIVFIVAAYRSSMLHSRRMSR